MNYEKLLYVLDQITNTYINNCPDEKVEEDVIKVFVKSFRDKYLAYTCSKDNVDKQQLLSNKGYYIFDHNCGYIKYQEFDVQNTEVFHEFIQEARNKNIDTLILDLRNNTGGRIECANILLSYLCKDNELYYYEDKSKHRLIANRLDHYSYYMFESIFILVDERTMSSAELTTLVLKSNLDNVTIFGTRTYGKGTISRCLSFSDGSQLMIPTYRYLSVNGNVCGIKGIEPDHPIRYEFVDDCLQQKELLQLMKMFETVS